ncbi:MAG: hypothetical protein IPJ88_13495 [Myxococcales bacterium]|nr:MAG: hypothetical protein IPJ88_13495 [Myxococcales bacterium]
MSFKISNVCSLIGAIQICCVISSACSVSSGNSIASSDDAQENQPETFCILGTDEGLKAAVLTEVDNWNENNLPSNHGPNSYEDLANALRDYIKVAPMGDSYAVGRTADFLNTENPFLQVSSISGIEFSFVFDKTREIVSYTASGIEIENEPLEAAVLAEVNTWDENNLPSNHGPNSYEDLANALSEYGIEVAPQGDGYAIGRNANFLTSPYSSLRVTTTTEENEVAYVLGFVKEGNEFSDVQISKSTIDPRFIDDTGICRDEALNALSTTCGELSKQYYQNHGDPQGRADDSADEQKEYLHCVMGTDSIETTGNSISLGKTQECEACILVFP